LGWKDKPDEHYAADMLTIAANKIIKERKWIG
jgi:hypothetical protein